MEAQHTYELVEDLDGEFFHLRCPTCGKEVIHTVAGAEYRVLRDQHGTLLQGDFFARHSWGSNLSLAVPGVL